MAAIPVKPCKHEACGCKVDDDQSYCSAECRHHDTDADGKCTCGHSECVVQAALRRNDQDGGL